MAKELYLYSGIYDFTAEDLIAAMEENKSDKVTLRINSPGGSVFAGWGIIAKMQELDSVSIKVDGAAMSMAGYFLLFSDNVEALDVSTFMFHRADMYVSNPEQQAFLDKVNSTLRAKMEARIGSAKFKAVTGTSIKDLFESEKRIDLFLDAKQMKELGIVKTITKLKPAEAKAFNDKLYAVAATAAPAPTSLPNPNPIKMTIEKLKAEFSDVFAAIFKQGVDEERDRTGALLAYMPADPEAVTKLIKDGGKLTQTMQAEFGVKMLNASALEKIKKDSAGNVITEAPAAVTEMTAAEKELFEKENRIRVSAGLKPLEAPVKKAAVVA